MDVGTDVPGETGRDGYICKGIAYYIYHVPPVPFFPPEAFPLYCYWREEEQDHFYSMNGSIGLDLNIVPRVVGFCSYTPFPEFKYPGLKHYSEVSLHQYYNKETKDHCYTTKEKDEDLKHRGYDYEDRICSVLTKNKP